MIDGNSSYKSAAKSALSNKNLVQQGDRVKRLKAFTGKTFGYGRVTNDYAAFAREYALLLAVVVAV